MCIFLRLSYWQWERHQWKIGLISEMRQRLDLPVVEIGSLTSSPNVRWNEHVFQRVTVSGTFDFEHEMLLRNRKFGLVMGLHILTPLHIEGTSDTVLVDRGFIPQTLADIDQRKTFQKPARFSFTGLIKESMPPKFLAPRDPPSGPGQPWVERWLRVDLENMQRQLPYPILPVYTEIVETSDTKALEQTIVDESGSGRDEMFFMNGDQKLGSLGNEGVASGSYPIPMFNTVIPPGRHLGYVFEWGAMAVMTFCICLVLQLRRPALGANENLRR